MLLLGSGSIILKDKKSPLKHCGVYLKNSKAIKKIMRITRQKYIITKRQWGKPLGKEHIEVSNKLSRNFFFS